MHRKVIHSIYLSVYRIYSFSDSFSIIGYYKILNIVSSMGSFFLNNPQQHLFLHLELKRSKIASILFPSLSRKPNLSVQAKKKKISFPLQIVWSCLVVFILQNLVQNSVYMSNSVDNNNYYNSIFGTSLCIVRRKAVQRGKENP